jgi:hypothetical protein
MLKILIPSLFAITLCASEVTQTSLPLDLEFAQKALQNKAYQDSLNRYIDIKKYYEDRNMVNDVINIQSTILYIKKEMAAAKASKTTAVTTASGTAPTASATTAFLTPAVKSALSLRDKNIEVARNAWKKSLENAQKIAQQKGDLDLTVAIKNMIEGKDFNKKLNIPSTITKANETLSGIIEKENGKYKKAIEGEISSLVKSGKLNEAGELKKVLEGVEKENGENTSIQQIVSEDNWISYIEGVYNMEIISGKNKGMKREWTFNNGNFSNSGGGKASLSFNKDENKIVIKWEKGGVNEINLPFINGKSTINGTWDGNNCGTIEKIK